MNTTQNMHHTHIAAFGKIFMVAVLATIVSSIMANSAYADAGGNVVQIVRNMQGYAYQMVTPLGTLAIIILGITAMLGRITWTQALVVAVGIAIASGAPGIYNDIAR